MLSARVNGLGGMVAAVVVGPEPSRSVKLVVWCGEQNSHLVHDFSPDGRVPVSLFWDSVEPKLLVVQMQVGGQMGAGWGGPCLGGRR